MVPSPRALVGLLFSIATGCASSSVPPVDTRPTPDGCSYPGDAAHPMEVGQPLYPYRWKTAKHRDGRTATVDLHDVPCASDTEIDWSPFDVLVFISLPAW